MIAKKKKNGVQNLIHMGIPDPIEITNEIL